jgi:hypothetical protein
VDDAWVSDDAAVDLTDGIQLIFGPKVEARIERMTPARIEAAQLLGRELFDALEAFAEILNHVSIPQHQRRPGMNARRQAASILLAVVLAACGSTPASPTPVALRAAASPAPVSTPASAVMPAPSPVVSPAPSAASPSTPLTVLPHSPTPTLSSAEPTTAATLSGWPSVGRGTVGCRARSTSQTPRGQPSARCRSRNAA